MWYNIPIVSSTGNVLQKCVGNTIYIVRYSYQIINFEITIPIVSSTCNELLKMCWQYYLYCQEQLWYDSTHYIKTTNL